MLEAFLGGFAIAEIFITLGIVFYIAGKAEIEYRDKYNFILSALGDFIRNLFVEKNLFGIILSLPIFVVSIPAFLLLLLIEAIMWLIFLGTLIWDLGNKKQS